MASEDDQPTDAESVSAETDGSGDRVGENPSPEAVAVGSILDQLSEIEEGLTDESHRESLAEAKQMIEQLPGKRRFEGRITKYTTRDMGEAAVGSIIFAVPLLVEDGVFEIADHFLEFLVAGIPVFLFVNIAFVFALTAGLLYAVDFREVKITNPLFGLIPRRLVGVGRPQRSVLRSVISSPARAKERI